MTDRLTDLSGWLKHSDSFSDRTWVMGWGAIQKVSNRQVINYLALHAQQGILQMYECFIER